MSASSLPFELWRYILKMVTHIPFELDTDPPNAFAYPRPWSNEEIEEASLRSMAVKRRMVLVCKQWNVLAMPFLYRIIVIRESSTIHRLASTLKSISSFSTASEFSDSSGPGVSTKRLDICLQKNDKKLLNGTIDLEDVGILIHSFCNLEILVVKDKMSWSLFDKLFDLFTTSGSQKLRKLDVYFQHTILGEPHFPIDSYRYLVRSRRELRFLRYNNSFIEMSDKDIYMDNIEFMDIPSTRQGPFTTSESNSESRLPLSIVWNIHPRTIADILKNINQSPIGARLTALEVDYLSPWESKSQRDGFSKYMHRVSEAFPNLCELIIRVALYHNSIGTPYIPPVKKLGMRICLGLPPVPKVQWKQLCMDLVSLVKNTHSIEIVRILDGPTMKDTQSHAGILKTLRNTTSKMLESMRGVRLEDENGYLFHDEDAEGVSPDK